MITVCTAWGLGSISTYLTWACSANQNGQGALFESPSFSIEFGCVPYCRSAGTLESCMGRSGLRPPQSPSFRLSVNPVRYFVQYSTVQKTVIPTLPYLPWFLRSIHSMVIVLIQLSLLPSGAHPLRGIKGKGHQRQTHQFRGLARRRADSVSESGLESADSVNYLRDVDSPFASFHQLAASSW